MTRWLSVQYNAWLDAVINRHPHHPQITGRVGLFWFNNRAAAVTLLTRITPTPDAAQPQ